MSNAAEILPALDRAEEHLDVYITVCSLKHDCHTAYVLSSAEIENGDTDKIINDMSCRLLDFIKEKSNATSEGKEG